MPKAEKNKVVPDAESDDRSHASASTFDDKERGLKEEAGAERGAEMQPASMFQEQTDDDFVEELEAMGLTCNHARVLLLIGSFARAARHADEKEGWIRQVPLIIMMYVPPPPPLYFCNILRMYEGITQGLLDFDYAPNSTLVSQDNNRCWA